MTSHIYVCETKEWKGYSFDNLMIYTYKVMTTSKLQANSLVEDVCFANSYEELLKVINYSLSDKFVVVSYKKKRKQLISSKNTITTDFIIPFFKNMQTLIANNIDITNALRITASSFENNEYRAILNYLVYRIENGSPLYISMKDTNIFDTVCIKSIEISEKTATLSQAFQYCTEYTEENSEVGKLIKDSLVYPVILLSVILIVTFCWIFFIIPSFAESFADIGIKVPLITRSLLGFRNFCMEYSMLSTVFFIGLIYVFIANRRKIFDFIPVVKHIKRDMVVFRFFSSMCLMLHEKINFLDALSSSCSDNDDTFRKHIERVENMIKSGHSISESFKQSRLFTNMENSIIMAGESAGNMYGAFKITSDAIRRRTKHSVNKATAMLQPVVTIVMGLILVLVVYSVLLPIYDQLNM